MEQESAPRSGLPESEHSRRRFAPDLAKWFAGEVEVSYAETLDPFGPGGVLVEGLFESNAIAEKVALTLTAALGASGLVYLVKDRRVFLQATVAGAAGLVLTGNAEANGGTMLDLTTTSNKTARVEFIRLDGTTFYFRAGGKTFSRPITGFDATSQAKIRRAAGIGAPAAAPAAPEAPENTNMVGAIPAMVVGEAPKQPNRDKMASVNRLFKAQFGAGLQGQERTPILTDEVPFLMDVDMAEVEKMFPVRPEVDTPEFTVMRGKFKPKQCKVIKSISANEVIAYGEFGKCRRITWVFVNKWDYTAKDLLDKVNRQYFTIKSELESAFGAGQEKFKYGGDDFEENECIRFDDGLGHSYLLFGNKERVYLQMVPTADADQGGTFDYPNDKALETMFAQRLGTNKHGDKIMMGLASGDQGDTNLCGPSCISRIVAHLQRCRPDMVGVHMRSIAIQAGTTQQGTMDTDMTTTIRDVARSMRARPGRVSSLRNAGKEAAKGTAVIWTMNISQDLYNYASQYTRMRFGREVKDMATDLEVIPGWDPAQMDGPTKTFLDALKDKEIENQRHYLLVLGINEETDEIFIANAYGTGTIQCLPMKVADKISEGVFWSVEP